MKKKLILILILTLILVLIDIYIFFFYAISGELFSGEVLKSERYLEIEEIYKNNELIGKTREEVTELIGKPEKVSSYDNDGMTDVECYTYGAGYIYEYLIFGHRNFFTTKMGYALFVTFKGEVVESVHMSEYP